ncbi:MAG: acetate--CoA ligase [Pseudomonadota bacterium]
MNKIYPPKTNIIKNAYINREQYVSMYEKSIAQPEAFWAEKAEEFLDWITPWKTVFSGTFEEQNIRWFDGAELNVCYNCVDRHLADRAEQTAIIWESDDPNNSFKITYKELHQMVCRFANVLKSRNIKKGDRVCIYMPMIPEAVVAMLACTRIGAIHSVVFGGFSAQALENRIIDADCCAVITADESVRGNKTVPLKENVDYAVQRSPNVKTVIVVKRTGKEIPWEKDRDIWYQEAVQKVSDDCPAEPMQAEDPLFILYTSGSTGKPKGILHTTAGYLLYTALTFKYVFDYHDGDIYWCTADIGWITGHSYIVYGPLANGATNLIFEGMPSYPDYSRFWQVIDKHQVNIFYTAPTAIRSLMRQGDELVKTTSRQSLRLLGSVGEPINPEAWEWYYHVVGEERCPIVDTWWQTETGGIMLTPLPGATSLKPGSVTQPMFGIVPALVNKDNEELNGEAQGHLVIKKPWPGMMRTVYGDPKRFHDIYLALHPGYYTAGDSAFRDEDGDYWIIGRIDDVINVAGRLIGTAEIESALVLHPHIAEAAVVAVPHDIKGNCVYVFATVKTGIQPDDKLKEEMMELVKQEIGSFAKPDDIQFASDLPKTRSGKIMRRILRRIVNNEIDKIGDTSTLANPAIIDELLQEHTKKQYDSDN